MDIHTLYLANIFCQIRIEDFDACCVKLPHERAQRCRQNFPISTTMSFVDFGSFKLK